MTPERLHELALIDEAVKEGSRYRRFPPGGGVFSGEEAVEVLRRRGFKVSQRLGSYKVSTVNTGMNAEEIIRFASYVKVADVYATPGHKHAAQKAYHAAQAGLKPRVAA